MASRIKLPRGFYLSWRARADGVIVYRWGMAPGLRKRGVKAFDLVDDAGAPLDQKAAIARAKVLTEAMKSGVDSPAPRVIAAPGRTVGDLLDAYLAPDNLARIRTVKTGEPLREASKRTYKGWRTGLDEVFADQPVSDIDHDLINDWFAITKATRGHHMAHGGYTLLRLVCNWADKSWGVADVEWKKARAPKPAAKLRVGHPDELACLLMAMDNPAELYARLAARGEPVAAEDQIPARPELGDSLVIAVWTTQRVADVLAFTDDAFAAGRLRWVRTSKNNRALDMPQLGPLLARIEQAKARKKARGVNTPQLVCDPDRPHAYDQQQHGRHFREARALAAKFYPSLIGEGLDPWGRAAPRFTFEDCRDTGITRLHEAGCDLLEICSWSNHTSPKSLMQVIAAYIEISGRTADRAGVKMQAMWNANKWVV